MPVPAGIGVTPDLLATTADLAAALQIPEADLDLPAALLALAAATAAVQAAAGQRIVEIVDDQAVLDVDEYDGGTYLALPEGPVTAVTSAQVGSLPVVDYTAQLSRGRLWRPYGWRSATLPYSDAPSTVTVVYTHGYPAGDQRLQLARSVTLDLAVARYNGSAGTVVREQIDDYAVQYQAAATQLEATGGMTDLLRRRYGRRGSGSVRLVKAR
jgi:hypothetical protein